MLGPITEAGQIFHIKIWEADLAKFLAAVTLSIYCLFSNSSFAAQNVALTRSDASIKEFQRKVVLLNSGVGHEPLEAAVLYCPFKGECKSRDPWSFALADDWRAADARNLGASLGLGRFDPLWLSAERVTITTPYGKIYLESPGAVPGGGVMSQPTFLAAFEQVLQERAAGIAQALADAVDLRAKSLRDKEAGTAMTGRMKTSGLDVATLRNMMDDGYAFAGYVPTFASTATISESKTINPKTGAQETEYAVKLTTNVTAHIFAYHFDADSQTFKFYKQWSAQSGPRFALGNTYKNFPKSADVREALLALYASAYESALADISLQVMRDENFSLQTKITEVDWNDFKSNLHAGLDVRVDSLWRVSRQIDGASKPLAMAKARQVAPAPKEGEEAYSGFAKIKGDAEQGDQLSEVPSTGSKGYFGLGGTEFDLQEVGSATQTFASADPKHTFAGLKGGFAADLGYKLNSASLSELWISIDLSLAGGSEFALGSLRMDGPTFVSLDVGLEKTLYLGSSGLSISPALKLGYSQLDSSGKDTFSGDTYDLKLSEVTVKPGISLDYTLDSFNQISLELEYPVQLSESGTLKNADTSVESALIKNKFGQGPAIFLMYRLIGD